MYSSLLTEWVRPRMWAMEEARTDERLKAWEDFFPEFMKRTPTVPRSHGLFSWVRSTVRRRKVPTLMTIPDRQMRRDSSSVLDDDCQQTGMEISKTETEEDRLSLAGDDIDNTVHINCHTPTIRDRSSPNTEIRKCQSLVDDITQCKSSLFDDIVTPQFALVCNPSERWIPSHLYRIFSDYTNYQIMTISAYHISFC